MNGSLDSTGLFLQQVSDHVQLVTDLLGTRCESAPDADLMNRCLISSKMLANSTALLGLSGWEQLLGGYESLLADYQKKEKRWDEKIAQITSELIEKEEMLSRRDGDKPWDPESLITSQEVQALLTEVSILISLEEGAQEPCPELAPMNEQKASAPAAEPATEKQAAEVDEQSAQTLSDTERPEFIGGLISQLDTSNSRLLKEWREWKSRSNDPTAFDIQSIKQDAYLINFYALSLVEIVEMNNEPADQPTLSSLEHLRVVLDLYAALLSQRDGCRVDIGFLGEDNSLDVSLLFTAAKILKSLISDISQRSSESYLRIEIEVEHRNGALWWCIRDNGNNFITDSRLDRDDFLAFYPGLREVRRQLEQFNGVLWVEPDEDRDRRFAFTMPLYTRKQAFTVWKSDADSFCMPSLQICEVIPVDEAEIYQDARGEYVTVDESQVPLLKLSLLCSEAPEHGDRIIVAGSLEKRIAFYAPDAGNTEEGIWEKTPMPEWNGLSCGVAVLGDERVPVIEGTMIVQSFLAALGSASDEQLPGSIITSDPAHSAPQLPLAESPDADRGDAECGRTYGPADGVADENCAVPE